MESKQHKKYTKPASVIFSAAPELLTVSGGGNIRLGGGVSHGGAHSKANDMWNEELDDEAQE